MHRYTSPHSIKHLLCVRTEQTYLYTYDRPYAYASNAMYYPSHCILNYLSSWMHLPFQENLRSLPGDCDGLGKDLRTL